MRNLLLVAVLALTFAAPALAADAPPKAAPRAKPAPSEPVEKTAVAWEFSEKVALTRAAAEKKPVLGFVFVGGG